MKILFWDIDGTILRTAKAGLYAFQQATEEQYGRSTDFSGITTAGMTDCIIAHQIIKKITQTEPSAKQVAALVQRYTELLPHHLSLREGFVIPPVADILDYLHSQSGYVSLLLTGNVADGARAKLSHYGIDHFFDFAVSAFGDECLDRGQVAAQAWARVQERYPGVDAGDIYVIGDTPNDINCGKHIGARTVAVATGAFRLEELVAHSPWWAVESLPSPEEFVTKIASAE